MKKVAIFVEGMTEQEFVVALVTALTGSRGLEIELAQQFRGKVVISSARPSNETEFYVLVVDCCGDSQVKTQIREQYASLVKAGYTSVIGLRDVFPIPRDQLQMLKDSLGVGMPRGTIPASLHLAVMEVETWFLAEMQHFSKISGELTIGHLEQNGFDMTLHPESWENPAITLDQIYKLAQRAYLRGDGSKSKKRVQRTLRALSYDEMYVTVRNRIPALDGFINNVEAALF